MAIPHTKWSQRCSTCGFPGKQLNHLPAHALVYPSPAAPSRCCSPSWPGGSPAGLAIGLYQRHAACLAALPRPPASDTHLTPEVEPWGHQLAPGPPCGWWLQQNVSAPPGGGNKRMSVCTERLITSFYKEVECQQNCGCKQTDDANYCASSHLQGSDNVRRRFVGANNAGILLSSIGNSPICQRVGRRRRSQCERATVQGSNDCVAMGVGTCKHCKKEPRESCTATIAKKSVKLCIAF